MIPLELELKYVAPATAASAAAALLAARCRRDPGHADDVVHSVYFDTPHWQALAEKQDGDLRKTRLRVRWYAGGGDEGGVWLEVKERDGRGRAKRRLRTGWSARAASTLPLADPQWLELVRLVPELVAAGVAWRPALEIAYRRRRFVDPATGLRIALDDSIVARRSHAGRLPPPSRRALSVTVLEVKGDAAEVPPALARVAGLGFRRTAFSKYAAALASLGIS